MGPKGDDEQWDEPPSHLPKGSEHITPINATKRPPQRNTTTEDAEAPMEETTVMG
jgi:hypothetical protein